MIQVCDSEVKSNIHNHKKLQISVLLQSKTIH